jgi:hypothetical protein
VSGTLDGLRKFALMLGANKAVLRIDYLGLARNKPAQKIHLLIVYFVKVLGAKETLLYH